MGDVWSAFVLACTKDETQTEAAKRVKVSQPTMGRWMRGEKVPNKPTVVARFARAYGADVMEAFIAAGLITQDDIGPGTPPDVAVIETESVDAPEPERSPRPPRRRGGNT